MAEPKEIHPLDELFRKSFDDLPAAPATNGWDAPSAQVWEQVQERIKTPRQNWGQWTLVVLVAIAAAAGLWAYSQGRPKTDPATQPQTEPQEQKATPPQTDNANVVPATDAETTAKTPATGKSKKQTTPATTQPATETEPLPGSSKPLPGAKKVFPNNTERNKRQDVEDDTSDENVPAQPLPKSGGGSH